MVRAESGEASLACAAAGPDASAASSRIKRIERIIAVLRVFVGEARSTAWDVQQLGDRLKRKRQKWVHFSKVCHLKIIEESGLTGK